MMSLVRAQFGEPNEALTSVGAFLFSFLQIRARTSDIMINSHALYRLSYRGISGAPPGTRTLDPLIKSQLLYQLS